MQVIKDLDCSKIDFSKVRKLEDYIPLKNMLREAGLLDCPINIGNCNLPCATINEASIKAMGQSELQEFIKGLRKRGWEDPKKSLDNE